MRQSLCFVLLLATAASGQDGRYPPAFGRVYFPESAGNTLYAVFAPNTISSVRHSLVRSDDRGRTWTPLYVFPAGNEQPIQDLAVHPTNPQIVLAATTFEKGGVYRSTDGGQTWQPSNTGLPATGPDAISSIRYAANDSQVVYIATRAAIYKSVDGGAGWTRRGALPQGPPAGSNAPERHTIVGIQRTSPARMYSMARGGAMYASTDEGATWTPVSPAKTDPKSYAIQIQIEAGNPNYIYLQAEADTDLNGRCTAPGSGLWQSPDGGRSWTLLRESGFCNASPFAFLDVQRPFVHLQTGFFGTDYCRSENRGATFTCFDTSGPVAIDPRNGDFLIAAQGRRQSNDAGRTWTATGATVVPTLLIPTATFEFPIEEGAIQTQRIQIQTAETATHRVPLTLSVQGGDWLRVTQANPQANSDMTVEVSSGARLPGAYTATIRVQAPESNNKTIDVPVRMVVRERLSSGLLFLTSRFLGGLANFSKPFQEDVLAADASAQSCSAVFAEANGSVLVLCNNRVRRIDGATKRVRTIAGDGSNDGDNAEGAPALQAKFRFPTGVVSTSDGAIWVADQFNNKFKVIRNGVVTTAIDNRYLVDPSDRFGLLTFRTPQKAILDADGRPVALTLLGAVKVPASGSPQTIMLVPASGDPRPSLGGICVDRQGGFFVPDSANHIVWRFRAGAWTRFTGTGTAGFNGDGLPGLEAQLNSPVSCATDTEGNLYIADRSNNRIRVHRSDGRVYTAAGNGRTSPEPANGTPAADAAISAPLDVATDTQGNVYVAGFSSILKFERQRAPKPAITQGSFVSAASGKEPLGQGSLFSLYGANLAVETALARAAPWPERLGGVQVKINSIIAPLYFSSTGQINGQVPFEIAAGDATVAIDVNGTFSDPIRARIVPAAPGILIYGANRAVAVNDSGAVNTQEAGAAPDSIVVVYFTGQGPLNFPVPTGSAAPTDRLVQPTAQYRATIGGQPADVLFLGLAPGFVGLGQANVKIPVGLEPGDHDLVLIVGDAASPPAIITIAPPMQ